MFIENQCIFSAKSSSSQNSDIFVKAKRVSLFWEISLSKVSLLWVGKVIIFGIMIEYQFSNNMEALVFEKNIT